MSKHFRPFFIILILLSAKLMAAEEHCVERHVKDAMVINQTRLPQYYSESEEAGDLFKKLIRLEKIMILPSRLFDFRAKKYNRAGHRLFCADLVAMDSVPDFSATQTELDVDFVALEKSSVKQLKKRLGRGLDLGVETFRQTVLSEIHHLETQPKEYLCLTRHFLESMARTAGLWKNHLEEAQRLKLQSPDKLIKSYLKNQIFALGFMAELDNQAGPIQKSGLALFCQDLVAIPFQK